MSTRANIVFREGKKYSIIYQHYDGYPYYVLSFLYAFNKEYIDPYGASHGLDYYVANFLFFSKLYIYRHLRSKDWLYYGYGINPANTILTDCRYLYVFDVDTHYIRVYDYWNKELLFEGKLEDIVEGMAKRSDVVRDLLNEFLEFFKDPLNGVKNEG